jgi:hypothetical protein
MCGACSVWEGGYGGAQEVQGRGRCDRYLAAREPVWNVQAVVSAPFMLTGFSKQQLVLGSTLQPAMEVHTPLTCGRQHSRVLRTPDSRFHVR